MAKNRIYGIVVVLLLASVIFTGCSSVTMDMTSNRFVSPETGAIHFENAATGVNRLVLVPDASKSPPDISSPNFSGTDETYYLGFGFPIYSHLDVSVAYPLGGVPTVNAKVQLVGPNFKDATGKNSKGQSFSLALSAGAGYIEEDGDDGKTYSYNNKDMAFDAAVIVGYRLNRFTMWYGGPFATAYRVHGAITQPVNGGNTYAFSGNGLQKGVNLGIEFGHIGFFRAEVAVVDGDYEGVSRVKVDAGILGGIQW